MQWEILIFDLLLRGKFLFWSKRASSHPVYMSNSNDVCWLFVIVSTVLCRFLIMFLSGIEIPKFVDTVTPQYKPKFDALLVELKEAEQKSLKESERLEKEVADVQELKKKLSTMTAEEYFEKHPELKKKFDDEIRNDYWGY
ncbi:hypothetical protein AABB24_030777 [Solanum stoloniferum]|uniref:ATP synthase subunit d, mitochondrial n=1 Tax=Solanum stoloniferum TaxID=62892 RepID=A0ABD2RQP7_9SOLN